MELIILLTIVLLIILWVFSKSVKQIAKLSEHRVETVVMEATQDDIKRRAKAIFDIDTVVKAAENTQLANMALDANPDLLNKLREQRGAQ